MTHLYLGNKYAYRKRIVKHISKIHLSDKKDVNVSEIENCQLAQTASVLLFRAYAVKALRVKCSKSNFEALEMIRYLLRMFREENKVSQKCHFQKVKQATFSVSFNLQMTLIDAFQDTSGCRGGPQDCLRGNE